MKPVRLSKRKTCISLEDENETIAFPIQTDDVMSRPTEKEKKTWYKFSFVKSLILQKMIGRAKRAALVSIKPNPVWEFSEYESPSKSADRKRIISHDACKKLNQIDLVFSTKKDMNKARANNLTLKKEEIGIMQTKHKTKNQNPFLIGRINLISYLQLDENFDHFKLHSWN